MFDITRAFREIECYEVQDGKTIILSLANLNPLRRIMNQFP
jgi:hypothetical protein